MIRHGNRLWPALFVTMLLLAGLAVAAIQARDSQAAPAQGTGSSVEAQYAEGEVLVKLKPGTTLGRAAVLAAELDAENVHEFRLLSAAHQRPYLLLRSARRSTRELLAALQSRPEVESASPNYRRRLLRQPNDPKYDQDKSLSSLNTINVHRDDILSKFINLN